MSMGGEDGSLRIAVHMDNECLPVIVVSNSMGDHRREEEDEEEGECNFSFV